jgi:hypothetical protein
MLGWQSVHGLQHRPWAPQLRAIHCRVTIIELLTLNNVCIFILLTNGVLMYQNKSSQAKPSRESEKELHRSRGRQILMTTRKFNLHLSILTETQFPRHLTIPFSPKRINLLQRIQPSSNIDRQRRARFPLGQQRTVMNEGFERP